MSPRFPIAIAGSLMKGAKRIFTGAKLVVALACQDDEGIYPV